MLDRVRPYLRYQINKYTCGPAALRHALLVYGVRVDTARLSKIAGTSWRGTDANQITRAGATFGCSLGWDRRHTPANARETLRNYSASEIPVLVCVDRDETPGAHWITVVHASSRTVTYLDSSRGSPIMRRQTWRAFLGRACAWYPASLPRGLATTIFDLYPLTRKGG